MLGCSERQRKNLAELLPQLTFQESPLSWSQNTFQIKVLPFFLCVSISFFLTPSYSMFLFSLIVLSSLAVSWLLALPLDLWLTLFNPVCIKQKALGL